MAAGMLAVFVPFHGAFLQAQTSPGAGSPSRPSTLEGMVNTKPPDASSQPGPLAGGPASTAESPSAAASPPGTNGYTYSQGGRRDPFSVVLPSGKDTKEDVRNLPPLQRVSLSELSLIGIIWGGFGYTAMVQTSDGKGYTVRPGTRLGSNNGVVDSITTSAVVVHEHLTDVYGHRQVRETVMRLHPKESQE